MTMIELFFSFRGRIQRKLFIIGSLALWSLHVSLFFMMAHHLNMVIDKTITKQMLMVDTMIEGLLFWPSLALSYKRMHDRNKSGKLFGIAYVTATIMSVPVALGIIDKTLTFSQIYFFAHFVLMIGVLMMFVEMVFYEGTEGQNKYGPDPLKG